MFCSSYGNNYKNTNTIHEFELPEKDGNWRSLERMIEEGARDDAIFWGIGRETVSCEGFKFLVIKSCVLFHVTVR